MNFRFTESSWNFPLRFHYAKKESYTGQWLNSMRHGYGKFTYHDGAVYEGRWEADLRHGQGLMRYPDGSVAGQTWRGFPRAVRISQSKVALWKSHLSNWKCKSRNDRFLQLADGAEVPPPVVVQLATTSFSRHLIDVQILVTSIFFCINHRPQLMSEQGVVHHIWR